MMFLLEYWILNYKNYFDKYTSVLTNNGWKRLKDVNLDNDLIAQFNSDFSISFEKGSNYSCVDYSGVLITITSSSGLSLLTVTPDSQIPYLEYTEEGSTHKVDYIHNINLDHNNYLYTTGKRDIQNIPELYFDRTYTKDELDAIQAEGVLKGYSVIINDNETSAYYLETNTAPFDSNDIIKSTYEDKIYTLSVPSGMMVTRRINKVVIGCTNV